MSPAFRSASGPVANDRQRSLEGWFEERWCRGLDALDGFVATELVVVHRSVGEDEEFLERHRDVAARRSEGGSDPRGVECGAQAVQEDLRLGGCPELGDDRKLISPRRPTFSGSRRLERRVSTKRWISASPAACPWWSFTCLR